MSVHVCILGGEWGVALLKALRNALIERSLTRSLFPVLATGMLVLSIFFKSFSLL